MKWRLFLVFGMCCTLTAHAWNAEGHRLVAHIAYDHMTPNAKARFIASHPVLDKEKFPLSFIDAAVWFDMLKKSDRKHFGPMHYIDLPLMSSHEFEGKAPETQPLNALMAYQQSRRVLLEDERDGLKQVVALRILLHVVADMHQPLHAATRLTYKYPKGDAGGNKVRLPKNDVSRNLHAYWDKAGGFLSQSMPAFMRARTLEKIYPCDMPQARDTDPTHWLAESYMLALKKAYAFNPVNFSNGGYQSEVYQASEERLALAGCRLAEVLNEIAAYGVPVVG